MTECIWMNLKICNFEEDFVNQIKCIKTPFLIMAEEKTHKKDIWTLDKF